MAEREEHDILVQDHGSIILVIPQNQDVKDWFKDHVAEMQTLGPAVAVEPRFLSTLLDGLEEEGFTIRTVTLPRFVDS
jgi:hypothetical protein